MDASRKYIILLLEREDERLRDLSNVFATYHRGIFIESDKFPSEMLMLLVA